MSASGTRARILTLQTAWSGLDVGWPRFLDRHAELLLAQLQPSTRNPIKGIPAAVLHSHRHWNIPEIAVYQYSDGVRFIAIDDRFINFLWGANAFLLSCLASEDDLALSEPLPFYEYGRGFISQFGRLQEEFIAAPVLPPLDILPDIYRDILSAWVWTQELFLVGHEYAHLVLGHVHPERLTPVTSDATNYVLPGGATLGFMTHRQIEELQADHQGASMALNVLFAEENLTPYGRDISISALDAFFCFLKAMGQILGRGHGGHDTDLRSSPLTHPSGQARQSSWRSHFSGRLTGAGRQLARAAQAFVEHATQEYASGTYGRLPKLDDGSSTLRNHQR